jgi:hypothetical protein
MAVNKKADQFKQAHQLVPGDMIALHYSTPCATVVSKITGCNTTVVIIEVPNEEPVRYTNGD